METSQRNRYHYPILKNNQRTMTDLCCLVLYTILSTIVILAFMYSYILEKQKNLLKPEDPSGRKCGYGQASNYPYIYFPSPFPESAIKSVCVEKCPTDRFSQINCLPNSLVPECKYNMRDHFNRSEQFIVYATKENNFLNLCQPLSNVLFDSLNSIINTQSLFSNIEDVYYARYIIGVMCPVLCVVLTSIYLLLINLCKSIKIILIGIYVLFILLLAFFSVYLFLPSTIRWFSYSHILGFLTGFVLIVLISYTIYERNYFVRSLKLLDIGAIYVRENKSLLVMPLLMSLFWAISFSIWITVTIFLYSIDSSNKSMQNYKFAYLLNIEHEVIVKILIFLSIIHFLWTSLIIQHIGKYVARVGTANWIMYVPRHFRNALYTMVRFHIGSVIMGSIFIFLFDGVTNFFYLIMPSVRSRLCCCFWPRLASLYKTECFKKYIGYWNQITYVGVGFNGTNLMDSGYKITPTIVKNLHNVSRAYKLAKWIVEISQLVIAILTTLICLITITVHDGLNHHVITLISIFLFSMFLSSFCFDAYDKAFETIIITIALNKDCEAGMIEKVGISRISDGAQDNEERALVYNEIQAWLHEEKQKQQISELKKQQE